MNLFDSHCHLEMGEFEADREAVLERAFAAGVRRMVTVGTTLEDGRRPSPSPGGIRESTRRWAFIPTTCGASMPGRTMR